MFLRRGWPPSSGSNAYYFWGKINSVLRCYQKLSHTLNSAMFIEPVNRASSSYGRKGRDWEKEARSEPVSEQTWAVASQGPGAQDAESGPSPPLHIC